MGLVSWNIFLLHLRPNSTSVYLYKYPFWVKILTWRYSLHSLFNRISNILSLQISHFPDGNNGVVSYYASCQLTECWLHITSTAFHSPQLDWASLWQWGFNHTGLWWCFVSYFILLQVFVLYNLLHQSASIGVMKLRIFYPWSYGEC